MRGPTRDPSEIRQWAERHGATPAEILPHVFDSEPAILTFLFDSGRSTGTDQIRPITWDTFFAQFMLLDLVLVYDDSPTCEILHADKDPMYRDRIIGASDT